MFFTSKQQKMSAEKIFWTEFLELYKESPSLWRIKSSDYSNRIMKNEAYEKLIHKLKEKYPDANREMVVKKINTFRTTYRKEVKKVQASEKSGAGTEDLYEPTLWYYHILSFLEDQDVSAPSTCTIADETQGEISPKTSATPHRPKRRKISEEDNLIKIACEHLQAQNIKSNQNNNDPDDAVAKGWAAQLKEMNSKQNVLARKLISDILYQGCVEQLDKSHVQEFQNVFQLTESSMISYASPPSPEEFANDPFASVSLETQESVHDYLYNYK